LTLVATLSLAAALAIGPRAACALDPERPIWRHVQDTWSVEDGLPQSSVNALAQTPDGYLWVGTYDGLARFDGFRFEVFRTANTAGLGNSGIRALFVDPEGRLWIGTGGGGVSLREPGAPMRRIPGTEGWLVRALASAGRGRLWIGSSGHGLASLDSAAPAGAAPDPVPIAPGVSSVNALHADPDGGLWIGTDGTGLWYRSAAGATTRIDTGGATLIVALHRDRRGDLWVGSAGGGLLRVRAGATHAEEVDSLGVRTVSGFGEDGEGSLWLATGGGGLLRQAGERMERHSRATGLPHEVLTAVLEDREGALWVGMGAAGLLRLQGGSFSSLGASDGLTEEVTYSIVEDAAGSLWVAAVDGTLSRGDRDRFAPVEVPGLPPGTPLRALAVSPTGELWMGTYGQGVWRRSRTRWHHYTAADGLANDHVRAILADRRGQVWAATVRGLSRFTGERWETAGSAEQLPSASLIALAEGPDGSLWFGMDGGGLGCLLADGSLRFYSHRDGLASDVVLSLRFSRDGQTLWIGTNGGLSRLAGGTLVTWTTQHGLPSDNVAQVAEDATGALWLGTAAGIARVETTRMLPGQRLDLRVFGRGAGLVSSQATAPSNGPLVARDGRLWFPTLVGLGLVDPRRLTVDEISPLVHVEEVVADGVVLAPAATLELPRSTARLEIRYTGICTRAAELVRFRHRLIGFDRTWVEAGARRTAHYTAVPPGSYRFEVIARNADGAESAAHLELVVPRRFWETTWFQLTGALAAIVLVAGAVWGRTRALSRRQRELEVTVAERTEALRELNLELADRNRQLAELSLRDSLTGLANRRRFEEAYGAEWRRAVRAGSWLSLALVDVDFFKQYNDAMGHAAGDACLRRVGEVLARAANRAGELAARWGGEEFAVLLPAATPEDCRRLAEIFRRQVLELAEPHPASEVADHITVSVGVASVRPSRGGDPDELFAAADAALYTAKGNGRNRVETAVIGTQTPSGGVPLPTA
jgi:diguanylate cyclase (GGDEF)-like protein